MIRTILAIIALTIIFFSVKSHLTHRQGNLIQPVTTLKAWKWEQIGGGSGGVYPEGDAIRCQVLKTDGTDWHVQLYQINTSLVPGREYQIHFMAKSDSNYVMKLRVNRGETGVQSAGLDQQVPLVPQWISYDYKFLAQRGPGQENRVPYFIMGSQTGTVWIKDIVVKES